MITQKPDIEALAARIGQSPWCAIDTEADSLHAYPEKLCLIQVSLPGEEALIDPLSGVDTSPFLASLGQHEVILHGADYDLRLLHRTYSFKPPRLFDTMIAARLVGETAFGLEALTSKFLGVTLEKGPQKANWATRPLTDRMIEYAKNDTRHLHPLTEKLRARLAELGRLTWAAETCERLIESSVEPRTADPDGEWRLSGAHHLNRLGLACLRSLFYWREAEAVRLNRPPFFVVSHDSLVAIANAAAHQEPLDDRLSRRWPPQRRRTMEQALEKALATPEAEWPEHPKRKTLRWSDAVRSRFDHIQARRDAQAKNLGLDPSLIAPKATLGLLAQDWATHAPRLMRWQFEVLKSAAP